VWRLSLGLVLVGALLAGLWLIAVERRGGAGRWQREAGASAGDREPIGLELADIGPIGGVEPARSDPEQARTRAAAGPALLAAGSVVDPHGNPVPRAWVDLGWLREGSVEPAPIRTRTDPSGSFELQGAAESEQFAVRAHRENGGSSEFVVARRGARDVRLVLQRPWSLQVRLLVQEARDLEALTVQLAGQADDPGQHHHDSDGFSRTGRMSAFLERGDPRLAFGPLAPGRYDLLFLLGPEQRELGEVQALDVRSDVDLGTIDLRGWIQRTRVVLTGSGEPGPTMGTIAWRPSGSFEPWSERWFEGREVELLTEVAPIDVRVQAAGYRAGLLHQVSGRGELALAPALLVRIALRTTGTLPAPPFALRCDLRGEKILAAPRGPTYFSEENRELVFAVSAPGLLRVAWKLQKEGITGEVLPAHAQRIEVRDVPGEQVFPIELDGAALDELLRQPPW
jgi:hypothetical protein